MKNHHHTSEPDGEPLQMPIWTVCGMVFLGMTILGCLVLAIWPRSFTVRTTVAFDDYGENPAALAAFGSPRFMRTQAEVVTSRTFLERLVRDPEVAAARGEVAGEGIRPLSRALSARRREKTQHLEIAFRSDDPVVAIRMADAVALHFVSHWQETQQERYDGILRTVAEEGNDEILRELERERARVVGAVRVEAKADPDLIERSPRFWRGFLLILGTASATALLAGQMLVRRSRVTGRQDIAEILREVQPPNLTLLSSSDHEVPGSDEPFRRIRRNLLERFPQPEGVTLAFVSCVEGESPTQIACEMARTLAQGGHRVLLVEGNLRQPSIHRAFGVEPRPGLTDYLSTHLSLGEAVSGSGCRNLWLLPGGRDAEHPSRLLASARLEEMIGDAKSRFDFVLFNGGALFRDADSLIFAGESDLTFLASQAGRAPGEALARARRAIEQSGSRFSGLILTGVESGEISRMSSFPVLPV